MTQAILDFPDARLDLNLLADLSEDDFFAFCVVNRDLRLERTADGVVLIRPPRGGIGGYAAAVLVAETVRWAHDETRGVVFDAACGFHLPSGAVRTAAVAWVHRDRLCTLSRGQWAKFLPLCPNFVIELAAWPDRLDSLQTKMDEYIANGAQLGWLIDPDARTVDVYRPGQPALRLDNPTHITGDPELPGFVLDLSKIWTPGF